MFATGLPLRHGAQLAGDAAPISPVNRRMEEVPARDWPG